MKNSVMRSVVAGLLMWGFVGVGYAGVLESLRQEAVRGDAKAQFNLGVMYNEGKGVPRDDEQALDWMVKAAEQGHYKAKLYVAEMTL